MERVTVAELKARLSYYLREVRAGNSFVVVSRDIPVAVLGPCDPAGADDLDIIDADPDAEALADPVVGHQAPITLDAVDLIRADRDDRDGRLQAIMREALHEKREKRDRDVGGDP